MVTFGQILALPKTCENIVTLQNLIEELENHRTTVLQSQSDTTLSTLTDVQAYDMHVIRSIPFNKMTCFGFLVECYLNFDNKLAIETDINIINTLTTQRMKFKESLKAQMASDSFCSYFSSLVKFFLN
jgi:hypothetical protein